MHLWRILCGACLLLLLLKLGNTKAGSSGAAGGSAAAAGPPHSWTTQLRLQARVVLLCRSQDNAGAPVRCTVPHTHNHTAHKQLVNAQDPDLESISCAVHIKRLRLQQAARSARQSIGMHTARMGCCSSICVAGAMRIQSSPPPHPLLQCLPIAKARRTCDLCPRAH